jgi:hypothetical protein
MGCNAKRITSLFLFIAVAGVGESLHCSRAEATAAGLSGTLSIVPGLGQTANGDALEGLAWFSTVTPLYIFGRGYLRQIAFDLWMYNMYDAYRDAKPKDGRVTQYNLLENSLAPYNPLNLFDPIGLPIVGFGAAAGAHNHYPTLRKPGAMITFGFVGLGEEGLFRGFLFPAF